MTDQNVKDVIRDFLSQQSSTDIDGVTDGMDLFEARILDSFGILSTVMFLEERYGFALGVEDLTEENFRSLDTLSHLVLERKTASDASAGDEPR